MEKLGCSAELIVDEFGEKLLEELDYFQEARNIQVTYLSANHYVASSCIHFSRDISKKRHKRPSIVEET